MQTQPEPDENLSAYLEANPYQCALYQEAAATLLVCEGVDKAEESWIGHRNPENAEEIALVLELQGARMRARMAMARIEDAANQEKQEEAKAARLAKSYVENFKAQLAERGVDLPAATGSQGGPQIHGALVIGTLKVAAALLTASKQAVDCDEDQRPAALRGLRMVVTRLDSELEALRERHPSYFHVDPDTIELLSQALHDLDDLEPTRVLLELTEESEIRAVVDVPFAGRSEATAAGMAQALVAALERARSAPE